MNTAMAAGAMAYSIRMAVPVANPPSGPSARRAKPYPAPATGMAVAISARPKTMQVYIVAIRRWRSAGRPSRPPSSPKFQPAKSPEMT